MLLPATILPLAMMAPPAGAEGGNPFAPLLMMGLIFVIFYFLLIRPQQQQAKKHAQMLKGIKKGDRVVTTGGLIGRVTGVHETEFTVEIAKDVNVIVQRGAVTGLVVNNTGEGKKE